MRWLLRGINFLGFAGNILYELFILIDSIDKIKKIELEPWYKNCVSNNDGIYIGNGINDQFSLRYTTKLDEMKQDVPNKFCFVIKKGKPMYVKYVTKFELNIKD